MSFFHFFFFVIPETSESNLIHETKKELMENKFNK